MMIIVKDKPQRKLINCKTKTKTTAIIACGAAFGSDPRHLHHDGLDHSSNPRENPREKRTKSIGDDGAYDMRRRDNGYDGSAADGMASDCFRQ